MAPTQLAAVAMPLTVDLPRLAVVEDRAWMLSDTGATIVALDGEPRDAMALPIDDARAVVSAGGRAWVLGADRVARFAARGAPIDATPIDVGGDATAMTACRIGDGAVVVQGPRPVRVDGRGARGLGATTEHAVPVAGGVVMRVGRRFALRGEHGTHALGLPGDLVASASLCGGAALHGGAAVALELRSRTGHHLVTVDLQQRETIVRMRLVGTRAIAWVEERGHAVLVRDGELLVIDLDSGRCMTTRRIELPVAHVAVDPRGERLVLATADGLRVIDYAELVGAAAPARAVAPVVAVAPVAPVPPVPPVVDDDVSDAAVDETITIGTTEAPALAATPAPVPPPFRTPALAGLGLARVTAPLDDGDRHDCVADAFTLVAAMCRRAIAEAWDSGRLGTGGALPFADEVAAILDGACGRTPEALELARTREQAAAHQFARWNQAGAPLADLAAEHALSDLGARIALVVAAPRIWPDLARIYTIVAHDVARPLIDELLVAQVLGIPRAARPRIATELGADAPLVRRGLVVRGAGDRIHAALSVPDAIALRLAGDRFETPSASARGVTASLGTMRAPHGAIAALCAALSSPSPSPARVVARGRAGSGRRTLAAALAATAGRRAGLVEVLPPATGDAVDERLRADLRDAALRGHLPCVSGLDALGDDPAIRVRLQRVLDDHPGPLVIRCGPGTHPPLAPGYHAIGLDALDEAERAAAWRDALERHQLAPAPAAALAARWAVGPGIAARAAAVVARDPERDASSGALDAAVRRLRADQLAGLADKVDRLATWTDLILPTDMLDSLRELVARVRHRDVVLRGWGMERVTSTARALTALFQGGPGTGKTLAAGVLARELGYDLYRVDLSRVMSRWLGETEKNLARIFDAAADGETILLFDEADALFGKRTEVKSSHDRYANVETNYLLQRLDSWSGIALLTTNFGTSIDPAFRRRLTLELQFPFPDDEEREQLWRAHLPATVPTRGDLDLAALAARYKLSGGYIRNAALRACYLAVGEGSALTGDHLVRAIKLEYRDKAKVAEGGHLE